MNIVARTPYTYYVSNVPYLYEYVEYHGASTDNKPTLEADNRGSKFYCVDNGDTYLWSGTAWVLTNAGSLANTLEYSLGNLPELDTDNKDTAVAAINEVFEDAKATHYNRAVVFESDFYTAAVPIYGATAASISSGTSSWAGSTVDHPGVVTYSDSTTANGGYRVLTDAGLLISGGEKSEFVFYLGAGAARATAIVRLGFQDSLAVETAPTDGVWLDIVGDGTKATISGKANDSTGVATTNTTYTAEVNGTWYRGTIELNADATLATFSVRTCADGLQVWGNTLATKIPTGAGRTTGWGIIAGETTTDAAAIIIGLDYANMSIDRTLVR